MNSLVEFIMGIFWGYLIVSITESIVHRSILHAKKLKIRFWEKLGCFGRYIQNSWYSHHVVHHFKTFKKNHVTMFESEQEEMALSRYLIKNDKQQIVINSYGLRVGGWYERLEYLYAHLMQFFLVCYLGGIWVSAGALIPLAFYVWLAEYVHPYIHLPYSQAIDIASPSMKWVIRTRYFKYLSRHHYLHHKYISCNFNLLLGGDVFWRCHRSPNKDDFIEMMRLGLFVPGNYQKLMKRFKEDTDIKASIL